MKTCIFFLACSFLLLSCTHDPSPEAFLTPTFEQVSLEENEAGTVVFTCRMSSVSQITECGIFYTEGGSREEEWTIVTGTLKGDDSFTVMLQDLLPGSTYAYRLFIGNGRTLTTSARNYYTVPE